MRAKRSVGVWVVACAGMVLAGMGAGAIQETKPKTTEVWLGESLAQFEAWRRLLEQEPERARAMVEEAFGEAMGPYERGEKVRALSGGAGAETEKEKRGQVARGMLVWRTLETVIDRERVDAALREFYKRYSGRAAGIGEFQAICEEISGRELGWFFEYYVRGTKLPEISLRRVAGGAPNELAGEIVVGNVPAEFTVRVELRIETEAGVVEHSLTTRGERTPFAVNVKGRVVGVRMDAERRVLRGR